MRLRLHLLSVVVLMSATESCWGQNIQWQTQQLSDQFYSEGATAGDFNHDGKMDVAAGPFWYAGPDFKKSHQFYAQDPFDPHRYSNNFFAFTDDFNGDGWDDILVYGFPGQDASWFENPKGAKRFWPRHQVLHGVDNESPTYLDIDGDGQREIICSVDGYFGFARVNRESPETAWDFTRISDKSAGERFTHGLGLGDINGDNRLDLLEKNGWWEQPESLSDDPIWKQHPFQFATGTGSAQMFADDVDGDGDNDVITALNAHGYGLAWYENESGTPSDAEISFKQHLIMGSKPEQNSHGIVFSQLHGVELVDIDGDGLKDILTGKRYWAHGPEGDADPSAPAVVYWFQRKAGKTAGDVQWIPHQIDDDSGVGTEVDYADLNADGAVDVITGNKKGAFVHIQSKQEGQSRRHQPQAVKFAAKPASSGLPNNEGLLPREAAAAMTVPDGFSVQLAAGEPMIHQPIAMTFDHRGRLWVAEAHTYPIRAPEGEGKDNIVILEDTDSDGAFDKRTVFIEGLNLVSGLEIGFGGVWVGAAPNFMFIPDRDGDDRPDGEPQILLDGWGLTDTHETLNSFTWGPDGWLYGCHGVFSFAKVGPPGTPKDQRTRMNAGVWRYHPVRHEFQVFAWGTSNPWGVDFNDYGQTFITACVIPHMFHMIQGGRYHRQGGRHYNPYVFDDIKTIADHAHYVGSVEDHAWWKGRNEAIEDHGTLALGGGHAHCGAMIYLGDNWPDQYRDSILLANVHGNRINNDLLRRNGSGYVASHGNDFLFANDSWFRGINLKYAPDGSVYLIDWYDKNACHRRDSEIWDRTNGRVYQIRFGQPDTKPVDLSTHSDQQLVALMMHENDWFVRMSRRLLHQRAVSGKLDTEMTQSALQDIAHGRFEVTRRLRAVWTLHVCGLLTEDDTSKLLSASGHKSEYLRAWAIQLDLEDGMPSQLTRLAELSRSDSSPLVRLYLASALQQLPLEDRWEIAAGLVRHADDAADHNLPLMIWYGIEPLVPLDTDRALALAAESRIPLVRQFIYRRAAADEQSMQPLLALLTTEKKLASKKLILAEIAAVLSKRGRLKMPSGWPSVFVELAKSEDAQVRQHAQLVTVKFGDSSIFPQLRQLAVDSNIALDSRINAITTLTAGKDPELAPLLIGLLDQEPMRGAALRALAGYADESVATAILAKYATFSPSQKSDAVLTLASRIDSSHRLLDAIDQKNIAQSDVSAFSARQMMLLDDAKLVEKLNRVWGSMRQSTEEKQARINKLKEQLTPKALAAANRSDGRVLYDTTCGKCHKLFGVGGDIGPDITGSNRIDLEYTLHNMIDPNALIGKDYQATKLLTDDGRVIIGLLKEENDSAVVIQTANEKLVVEKDEIASRTLSATSMMPEGQLDPMSDQQIRDLVAYLASPVQVALPDKDKP
jgi:putative membrane-bound dehydrogenase-like protein